MSARTYWVGLPVGVTVHDDGTLRVEVDMSEASSEMRDQWYEATEETNPDLAEVSEARVLADGAIVDANPNRSSGADVTIPPAVAEMRCPARYSCSFRTFEIPALVAHLEDQDEKHGDV